jgi:hypothetical protein
MKLEQISVNLSQHSLTHLSSSELKKVKFDKDGFGPGFMKYVEDYCSENGFEIINAETAGITRNYHLVKK